MFVALETSEPGDKGIFASLLSMLAGPKPQLETREAMGAVYGVITAAKPIRAAGWRRVEELAGRYADRMLLPCGLNAPPPIREPAFPRFERMVLLKTAVEIIRLTRMPMYRRVAALVDEEGKYADFLFPLLHHYTTIRVLTGRAALYEDESARMMEELGAPVVLCDDYSALADCVLVIAPDGISFPGRLGCPVLSEKPPVTQQHSDFITDLSVIPGPELKTGLPSGIEPHKFLAALYEYCGIETACRPADTMIWRYRRAGLDEVVGAVVGRSEDPSATLKNIT